MTSKFFGRDPRAARKTRGGSARGLSHLLVGVIGWREADYHPLGEMRIGADPAARDARRRILSGAGAVTATLVASYAAATSSTMMALLTGAVAVVALAFVPVSVFVGGALIGRDLADAVAANTISGALNAGALLGILVVAIAVLRILGMRRPIGIGAASLVGLLLFAWFAVGYFNFGNDPSLGRELIRSCSIIGLALVAANTIKSPRDLLRTTDVVVLATLVPAFVALWQMVFLGYGVTSETRAYGTLSHAIPASSLFVIALALSLWRVLDGHSRRPWYAAAALIFALALLGTRGLGGMAQALVTLLAYGILTRQGGSRRAIAATAAVGLVAVFVFTPFGESRVQEVEKTRTPTEAAQGYQENSLDWRFGNWAKLFDAWREKPILGYGSGTTATLVQPGGNVPHSDVLRLLVETGVIGFIVFGGAYLLLGIALHRRTRGRGVEASYCAIAFAIFAGLTVHSLANTVSTFTAPMYAAAVVIGSALAVLPQSHARRSGLLAAPRASQHP